MNWEAIGAAGEVGWAIAVVVSLVYLAVQLQQNTTTMRQQSAHDSTMAIQRVSLETVHADVASVVSRAYAESEPEFTPAESVTVEHFLLSMLTVFQQDYLDHQQGLHPSEV